MANKVIKSGGRVRRELADYILSCSYKELNGVLCALETETDIKNIFNCEMCKKLFGDCVAPNTKLCERRLEQYDNLSYTQPKEG